MLRKVLLGLVVLGAVHSVFCGENVEKKANVTQTTTGRNMGYRELAGCIDLGDARCFLDVADDIVNHEKRSLLAEAEKAIAARGRSGEDDDDGNETPTGLSDTIGQLMGELTDIVKEGISGFFRDGKDDEEDDEDTNTDVATKDDDDEEEDNDDESKKMEARGKKKKKIHKLIALIKLLVVGAVLAAKLIILLKLLAAHLQIKFLLIAFAGLILNAARFYLDLKKGHHPQKVIYYEHAQHQHHYEGEDDWSSGPSEGSDWGRSYEKDDGKTAQDIAYAKQKPYSHNMYEKDEDKSVFSWLG